MHLNEKKERLYVSSDFHLMFCWVLSILLASYVDLSHAKSSSASDTADFAQNQALLVRSLFANYDPLTAPINTMNDIFNPSDTDRFHLDVQLWTFNLISVNEPERKFDVVLEYTMYWKDFRLKWNPADFGGISGLYLHRSRVWTPELTPMNVISSTDVRESYQHLVWVTLSSISGIEWKIAQFQLQNNGSIAFVVTLMLSSICQYDVSSFPFDHQNCDISLDVRTMFKSHYDMTASMHHSFSYENLGNGEWDVLSVNTALAIFKAEYAETAYACALISVGVQRKPTFYILSFMVPTIVITSISTVGIFLVGADILSRVSVGLTNVMSMSFLLGVLNTMLPKTNTFPLLGVYFLLQFLLISLSLTFVLFINNRKLSLTRRKFLTVELYQMANVTFQMLNIGIFISFCTWVPQLLQQRIFF